MIDSHLPVIRARLLAWYDEHHRHLPWRSDGTEQPDVYRIWLSETMLQQTRVETVRSYYGRWLTRFPTLTALAEAPLDDVLKLWEGLGYYTRARNFHRAVREIRDRYAGEVPDDPDAFRALPGVGRYTAGAVMSIAFGQEQPVVDGNVRRVLARWTDQAQPREAELWRLAGALVRGERPGTLNQALMELGAVLCTPRRPRCFRCPVAEPCAAHAAGTQEERPARRRTRAVPQEDHVAVVIKAEEGVLLARRPIPGLLGGLWEFPGGPMLEGESAEAAAERLIPGELRIAVTAGPRIATVDHTFTHLRISYHVLRATLGHERKVRPTRYIAARWIAPEQVRTLALPKAQQRIASLAFATPSQNGSMAQDQG